MSKTKKEKIYKRSSFKVVVIIACAIIAIGAYAFFTEEEVQKYEYVKAGRMDIIQEISVTGSVKAVESVDLSFEASGRVSEIYAKVGDYVKKGDKLLSLNNADISAQLSQSRAAALSAQAQLAQYQATLEAEQSELDEMRKGTRPEEITIAQTTVYNAESTLDDAEINLVNVEDKAEIDLKQAYSGALTTLLQAVDTGKNALITLTDIQYTHFNGSGSDDFAISSAKRDAMYELFGISNAGSYTSTTISSLTSGLYGEVKNLISNYTYEEVDEALGSLIQALTKINITLNVIPIESDFSDAEKTNLNTQKTFINTEITNIFSKQQVIDVQEITNSNLIASAQSAVNTAKSTLASAQAQLDLKKAGYTSEQIASKEARIRQVEANISSQNAMISQAWANVSQYQALYSKTVLTAPIDGVVTRIEAKVGEIVFPSSSTYEVQVPVVSLIGEGAFEIETYIPEVDIASVKIGDSAKVTLDTYGDDQIFEAYVNSIDPAETIIEGVTTYKTKFLFREPDDRIRSGMTANADIVTAEKKDVIAIPQRSIIYKDSIKIVRILKTVQDPENLKKQIELAEESEVKTGIRGNTGYIEIIEGINEGDLVITRINEE